MNKRGVEISMNVIIVAAIGLLVLVVLSVIFLGRVGTFSEKSNSCEVQGGKCAQTCGVDDAADFPTRNPLLDCPNDAADNTQVCCIKVTP